VGKNERIHVDLKVQLLAQLFLADLWTKNIHGQLYYNNIWWGAKSKERYWPNWFSHTKDERGDFMYKYIFVYFVERGRVMFVS